MIFNGISFSSSKFGIFGSPGYNFQLLSPTICQNVDLGVNFFSFKVKNVAKKQLERNNLRK